MKLVSISLNLIIIFSLAVCVCHSQTIEITSFKLEPVSFKAGDSFVVRVSAEAKGQTKIGSYVLRISHPIAKNQAPPNFNHYRSGRAYFADNEGLYLRDNSNVDIAPEKDHFAVRVSTEGWKKGVYYFTIFAHNRPASGPHIVDHRNFLVRVQKNKVELEDLGGGQVFDKKAFKTFRITPKVLQQGDTFEIFTETESQYVDTWSIHHPYTIAKHESLPGFYCDESKKQAYFGNKKTIKDNGPLDRDKTDGALRLRIKTTDWPSGVHNLTIEPLATKKGPYVPSISDYRDFAVTLRGPEDHLSIQIEPSRYFAERTHFNTMIALSNGRIICDGKYSDNKGYTWHSYRNKSLKWGDAHARSAMMTFEFPNGDVLGLAYRTLPKENKQGVFIGKRYLSHDGGKTIEGPFDCEFHIPRAVGSQGHAFHPGPLYMRSIVQLEDKSLLALMCGWFDTDTKESPVHGQNYRRSFLCRSQDKGHTWHYYSTIAYEPNWGSEGWNEGSLRKLSNTRLIAAVRSGSDSQAWKDNPLCVFFSSDSGRHWSPPQRTGIDGVYPCLVKMSNGLLACSYGRPGAKIMFSADQGKTWTDHTSVHPERYSGYTWIVEAAENELLYGFGLRNGLDPETGERKNMLRLTNIHVQNAKTHP